VLEEEISNIFESPQTGSCSSETNRMNVVMQLQHQPLKFSVDPISGGGLLPAMVKSAFPGFRRWWQWLR
jgi:hypothetical protein